MSAKRANDTMRYVIYGAGATGGVMAARLAQAGRKVVLIGRGRHLEAMQAGGLTFRTPVETVQVQLPAVGDPSEVEFTSDDVVMLTMKTQDTLEALDALRDAAGDDVPVLCAQNAVVNERQALRRFRRVYGMIVRFPGMLLEPGVVANYDPDGAGEIEVGRYPTGIDEIVEQVAADLTAGGFDGQTEADIRSWKYEKVIINLGSPFAGIFGPGANTAHIREQLRAEALACYEAAGIEIPTADEIARLGRHPRYDWGEIEGAPPFASSLWQGIQRGLRTAETDYINGEIALIGAMHGVPTPYNRALNLLANRCARRGIEPGTYSVADFDAMVADEADGADV